MMQKYKTAFLGNTVSKTKREKIMQNFNIQPCQFQYDSYLSWYKKIFKWPRVRWFYCFYIYYKKKKKRKIRREGGREELILAYRSLILPTRKLFLLQLQDARLVTCTPKGNTLTYFLQRFLQLKISPFEAVGALGTLLLLSPIWRKSALTLLSVPVTPRGTYSCRN